MTENSQAKSDQRVCEDCADLIERERADLPGLESAALHIAVGALYGGSACDHVDWAYEDAAKAFEALWSQRGRERDRLRADLVRAIQTQERLRSRLRRATHDMQDARAQLTVGMKAGVADARKILAEGIESARSIDEMEAPRG